MGSKPTCSVEELTRIPIDFSLYVGYNKAKDLQKQVDRRKPIQAMLKVLHTVYFFAQKMMEVRV